MSVTENSVEETVARAVSDQVAERILKHDESLWGGPGVPEIGNRLGWLDIADRLEAEAGELTEFAQQLKSEGYTDALLLGMGGSSLGPEVLRQSFGDSPEGLKLQVLDSTHPDAIAGVEQTLNLTKTIFIVSSKSGGTIETLSQYKHFKTKATPEQFVVVTDPGSPLTKLADQDGLRRTFENDPNIGGRYSVMSYFGLVPAALAGYPVDKLIVAAKAAAKATEPATKLGATIGALALAGQDKLTFIVDEPLSSFGLWVEQLVAESTGKHGKGILPVADEPLSADPSVYGQDRVFVHIANETNPDATNAAAVDAFAAAGRPVEKIPFHITEDLGWLFFYCEFAVAVAGWALQINPFDQPNVQEAKDNTQKVLDSGSVPQFDSASDEALKQLLAVEPPHYVAILGYLAPDPAVDAAITELRAAIRAKTGMATTFGYGPRFQHSTGQEHKGGAPIGRFLQLTDAPRASVEIPGEPYDFGTLIASQAAGDLQTLGAHGLPAERVVLDGSDPAAAIKALTAKLNGLL